MFCWIQWQRRYVLGISICGSEIKIVRCERSGDFAGQVLEVKEIYLSELAARGFWHDNSEELMFIQLEDGTTHLEVQVGGNESSSVIK